MKSFSRLVLFIAFIVLLAFTLYHQQEALNLFHQKVDELDIRLAALFFFFAFILGSIFLIPAAVFAIAAGAIFGLFWGYLLTMVGFTCGALCTFLVSRYLAREFVGRHLPGKILSVINSIHQHGWKLVATLRLLGIIPASLIHYALGLTRIGIWEYTWASCVFTLPIGLVLTYAGTAGKEFIESGDLTTLVLSITTITAVAVTFFVLRRRYLNRQLPKLPNAE